MKDWWPQNENNKQQYKTINIVSLYCVYGSERQACERFCLLLSLRVMQQHLAQPPHTNATLRTNTNTAQTPTHRHLHHTPVSQHTPTQNITQKDLVGSNKITQQMILMWIIWTTRLTGVIKSTMLVYKLTKCLLSTRVNLYSWPLVVLTWTYQPQTYNRWSM